MKLSKRLERIIENFSVKKSIDKVKSDLSHGTWQIEFIKVNGDHRTMLCTRDFDSVAKISDNYVPPKGTREVPSHLIVVWDLEKDDYRCFRYYSLVSMKQVSARINGV